MRQRYVLRSLVSIIILIQIYGCVGASVRTSAREEIQAGFSPGQTVTNEVAIAKSRVPLLEGEWIVLGRGTGIERLHPVGRSKHEFVISSLYLGQIATNEYSDRELKRMIRIDVNMESNFGTGTGVGWGVSEACSDSKYYFVNTISNADQQRDCWVLTHASFAEIRQNSKLQEAIEDTRQFLIAQSINVPLNMVAVYYYLANRSDYLNVVYLFNPDLEGIPQTADGTWELSDWHKSRIEDFPDKLAYLEKIREWAEDWHARLKAGFNAAQAGIFSSG